MTTKRAALYLRTSTTQQTTENQRLALTEFAKRAGYEIVEEYEDHGVSGAKGRDKRPEFDRMLKDATRRQFDIILAWSVDRLGRSLQDLVGFLNEVHDVGCDLYLHQQGVDTTTTGGKALFQMMGVFAEFEREIIRERINAGLERAKAQGVKLGRRSELPDEVRGEIVKAKQDGMSFRGVAKKFDVSLGMVQRVVSS
jgi:DNA invertase Pin-like site-specific DNA recombinase